MVYAEIVSYIMFCYIYTEGFKGARTLYKVHLLTKGASTFKAKQKLYIPKGFIFAASVDVQNKSITKLYKLRTIELRNCI